MPSQVLSCLGCAFLSQAGFWHLGQLLWRLWPLQRHPRTWPPRTNALSWNWSPIHHLDIQLSQSNGLSSWSPNTTSPWLLKHIAHLTFGNSPPWIPWKHTNLLLKSCISNFCGCLVFLWGVSKSLYWAPLVCKDNDSPGLTTTWQWPPSEQLQAVISLGLSGVQASLEPRGWEGPTSVSSVLPSLGAH